MSESEKGELVSTKVAKGRNRFAVGFRMLPKTQDLKLNIQPL